MEQKSNELGIVPEDDPAIVTESFTVRGGPEPTDVYVAYPADRDHSPGVLVVHANKGIEPHFRDVARRLAKLGYVAMAPDLLTCKGGAATFPDGVAARAAIEARNLDEMVDDLRACINQLALLDRVDSEHLGVIGFCYGGRLTWRLATKVPQLGAAIAFYGSYPPLEDVPKIMAPVLGIYGSLDERLTAGVPIITQAMAEADKIFETEIYLGAKHAFFHDQNPDSYNPEAAMAAWPRATQWLDRWLRVPESASS